jgi:protein-S-isoprenylcysteine O-methyltransferase Ste14
MDELFYKFAIAVFLTIFSIIKHRLTMKHLKDGEIGIIFAPHIKLMLVLSSLGMLILPIVYTFTNWLNLFKMELVDSVRIAAMIAYCGVIAYMFWIMKTLSLNIALKSEKRYLVTTGPYKLVRHPLYGVFVLMGLVQAIIASNWIFLIFVPIIYVTMKLRLSQEEGMLIEEYGDEYLNYKTHTGSFFPKVL